MDEAVDLSLSSRRLTSVSNEAFEINPTSESLILFTSFEEWQKQGGVYWWFFSVLQLLIDPPKAPPPPTQGEDFIVVVMQSHEWQRVCVINELFYCMVFLVKSSNTAGESKSYQQADHGSVERQKARKSCCKCSFCGKMFGNTNALNKHLLTHQSDRPHVCPICQRAFKRHDHL